MSDVVESKLQARGRSSATNSIHSESELREILAQRLTLLHGIVLALGLIFFAVVVITRIATDETPWKESMFGAANRINLLQVIFNVGMIVALRRLRFGLEALRALDVFGTLIIALVCCTYAWWDRFIPGQEHHAILAVSNLLVLRAVLVPGSPRVAAALAILASLPCLIPLAVGHSALLTEGDTKAILKFAFFLSWSVISLILSVVVVRVVHGLRREVREAQRLGQYTLMEKIGEGGMGVVYRARHALLRRPTAVKILVGKNIASIDVTRFEREVQVTSELTHPNTVAIFDFGKTPDGVFYYAMEYLVGLDLAQIVGRFGSQYAGRVVHIMKGMLQSLAEAHSVGLVHRDIKPANVILCRRGGIDDTVKVLDFGLAKVMDDQEGEGEGLLGTPRYLAPETILDPSTTDARSDLYAVAAVGYYLLTGTHVFRGETVREVCRQHLDDAPMSLAIRLNAAVPPDLENVILHGLAKKPEDRPQSAAEFLEALMACRAKDAWSPATASQWWTTHAPEVGQVVLDESGEESGVDCTAVQAADMAGKTIGVKR